MMEPVHNNVNMDTVASWIRSLQTELKPPTESSLLDSTFPGVDRDVAASKFINYVKLILNVEDAIKHRHASEGMSNDSEEKDYVELAGNHEDDATDKDIFKCCLFEEMRKFPDFEPVVNNLPAMKKDVFALKIFDTLKMRQNEEMESDEVKSEYAFDGMTDDSDNKDEVKSVYAMGSENDRTDTENPLETDDSESVYAFEGMNTATNDSATVVADLMEKVDNAETTYLTYLGFAFVFLSLAMSLFLCKFTLTGLLYLVFMFIFVCISRSNYLDYLRLDETLCNMVLDRKIQHLNKEIALMEAKLLAEQGEVDIPEADEAMDDECVSVYAFEALNNNEVPSPEGIEDCSDVESVYAFDALNDNEAPSLEAIENVSDIESVYAFDCEDDDVRSVYAFKCNKVKHNDDEDSGLVFIGLILLGISIFLDSILIGYH